MKELTAFNNDVIYYALIGVVAFVVFANTLGHGFVYDDNRQVLMNPLIQRSELYSRALTSDVWAFKGGGDLAASNYFRPTFVAWMILNWRLFGASPAGWHLTSALLHVGVCLLLFALLLRLGCERLTAAVITLLFAVHPVHVESVAWISGATDTLFALFLLASLILAHRAAAGGRRVAFLISSIIAYFLALGSKEVAVFCFPLFWFVFRHASGERKFTATRPLAHTAPFAIAAVIYFVIRWWILGSVFLPVDDQVAEGAVLLTLPKLFVFYVGQMIMPLSLGPSLPIRPVEAFDLWNVAIPMLISIGGILLIFTLARRGFIEIFGFALLTVTLGPALNIANFSTEHVAHDRYLYLPVAGFMMIAVPPLFYLFDGGARRGLLAAMMLVAIVLGAKTISYSGAWRTSETLWRHAVTVDPKSSHAWSQLAASMADPGDALAAYERSLEVRPGTDAIVGKARALVSLGKYEAAIKPAREAISTDPARINAYTLFQAYEVEAYALVGLGRHAEAEASLRNARQRLPIYYAALTEKLAVVLYGQGRKKDALAELESARQRAYIEDLPASKGVFLRLGMLYAELGNREAAKVALREYLTVTEGLAAIPAGDRQQALQLLARL